MNCWAFKSANTLCQQSQQSSHVFPDMAMIGYDWLWIKTYSTGIGARWTLNYQLFWALPKKPFAFDPVCHMGMDQYLLIPFLVGWTSIYQLFWCSPGVQGFDTLPYVISSIYQLFWCSPGIQGFDTLPYFNKPPLTVSNSRSWSLRDVVVLGNIDHIGVDWNVSEQCSKALMMWDYSQLSNIINILGIMNQYILVNSVQNPCR